MDSVEVSTCRHGYASTCKHPRSQSRDLGTLVAQLAAPSCPAPPSSNGEEKSPSGRLHHGTQATAGTESSPAASSGDFDLHLELVRQQTSYHKHLPGCTRSPARAYPHAPPCLPTEGCHLEQARVKGSDPTEMQYKAGTESSSSSSNSGHLQLQNETQMQEPGFVLAACDPIGSSWMGSVEVSTCTHGYASTLTPTGSRARTLGTLGPVLLHISLPPPAPHLRTRTKKKKKNTRRAGSRHSGSGHTRLLSISGKSLKLHLDVRRATYTIRRTRRQSCSKRIRPSRHWGNRSRAISLASNSSSILSPRSIRPSMPIRGGHSDQADQNFHGQDQASL